MSVSIAGYKSECRRRWTLFITLFSLCALVLAMFCAAASLLLWTGHIGRRTQPATSFDLHNVELNGLQYSLFLMCDQRSGNLTQKQLCTNFHLWSGSMPFKTRSQAVARIADRTAKNCKGHVT